MLCVPQLKLWRLLLQYHPYCARQVDNTVLYISFVPFHSVFYYTPLPTNWTKLCVSSDWWVQLYMTPVLCSSSSCRNCCSFPPTPPLAPPSPAPPLVWTPCHEDVAIALCSFCACCCTNLCHSTLSALIFEFFALTLEHTPLFMLSPYKGMTGLKRSVLTRANL